MWGVFQWSCTISRGMVNFKDTVLRAIIYWFCTKVLKNPMFEHTAVVFSVSNTPENWVFVRGWGWRGNVFLGSYLGLDSSTDMLPLSCLAVCCLLKRVFSERFSEGTLISQIPLLMCMDSERLHLPHRLTYWLSIRKDVVLSTTKETNAWLKGIAKAQKIPF